MPAYQLTTKIEFSPEKFKLFFKIVFPDSQGNVFVVFASPAIYESMRDCQAEADYRLRIVEKAYRKRALQNEYRQLHRGTAA